MIVYPDTFSQELVAMIKREQYPVDFCTDEVEALPDYCFSIIVEDKREEDYFTERLTECFTFGTVPIYYGASNIHQYFDGVLQFDTADRLQKILGGLTMDAYVERLPQIYLNMRRLGDTHG